MSLLYENDAVELSKDPPLHPLALDPPLHPLAPDSRQGVILMDDMVMQWIRFVGSERRGSRKAKVFLLFYYFIILPFQESKCEILRINQVKETIK